MELQPVNKLSLRGNIVAECEGAYLKKLHTEYALIVEGVNNVRYWPRRAGNFDNVLAKANAVLAEWTRSTNPLGILCLECGELCHLSQDGKRWLCKDERHN